MDAYPLICSEKCFLLFCEPDRLFNPTDLQGFEIPLTPNRQAEATKVMTGAKITMDSALDSTMVDPAVASTGDLTQLDELQKGLMWSHGDLLLLALS